MVAHGLLLFLGLEPDAALGVLSEARTLTAEGVGKNRVEWGRRF
jgi:hypothetical protein